jgi:hypothetical protein
VRVVGFDEVVAPGSALDPLRLESSAGGSPEPTGQHLGAVRRDQGVHREPVPGRGHPP